MVDGYKVQNFIQLFLQVV